MLLEKLILKLYLVGETALSKNTTLELRNMLTAKFTSHYALTVIDILKNPELAEKDKILAAPTLLRCSPLPVRKIIGDLTHREKVLLALDARNFKSIPQGVTREKT